MAQSTSYENLMGWLEEEEDLRDPEEMELVLENPDEGIPAPPAIGDQADDEESLADQISAAFQEHDESDEDEGEAVEMPAAMSAKEEAANEASLEADLWDALRPTFLLNRGDDSSSVSSDEDAEDDIPAAPIVEPRVEQVKSVEKEKVVFGQGALLTGPALETLMAEFNARLGERVRPRAPIAMASSSPAPRDAALGQQSAVQDLRPALDEGTPAQDTGFEMNHAVVEDEEADLDAAGSLFGDEPVGEELDAPVVSPDSAYASGENKADEHDLEADMDVPSPVGEQISSLAASPDLGDAAQGPQAPEFDAMADMGDFSFSTDALGSPLSSPAPRDPTPLPAELGRWEPMNLDDFDPATGDFRPGTASATLGNPAPRATGLALPAVVLAPMTAEEREAEDAAMIEAMADIAPRWQQQRNPVLQPAGSHAAAAPQPAPIAPRPRLPELPPHPALGNPYIDLEARLDNDWIDDARQQGKWGIYDPKAMVQPHYIFDDRCPFDERNPRMMYEYMHAVLVAELAPWHFKGRALPSPAALWWFCQAAEKFMAGFRAREHLTLHLPHELQEGRRTYWPLFTQERGLNLLNVGYVGQEAVDWIVQTVTALGQIAATVPPEQRGSGVPDMCHPMTRVVQIEAARQQHVLQQQAAQMQPAQQQHIPPQQAAPMVGLQQAHRVRSGRVERRRAPNTQQRRAHVQQVQRAAAAGQLITID